MIGELYLLGLSTRLDDALALFAERVARRAQELAPVDSGTLQASISATGSDVVVTAPYAAVVEERTPFLRPALAELRSELPNCLKEV